MIKQVFSTLLFTVSIITNSSTAAPVSSADDTATITALKETITEARTGKSVAIRTDAAERLVHLTQKVDPNKVDDKALSDLISLLDAPEDSVRFWVAGALGLLGPRAKAAAPKLLKLLPEADRLRGSLTSAPAIRLALTRIGVTPPPEPQGQATK